MWELVQGRVQEHIAAVWRRMTSPFGQQSAVTWNEQRQCSGASYSISHMAVAEFMGLMTFFMQ